MEAVKRSNRGNIVMEQSNVLFEVALLWKRSKPIEVALLWKQLRVLFEVKLLWKQIEFYMR